MFREISSYAQTVDFLLWFADHLKNRDRGDVVEHSNTV